MEQIVVKRPSMKMPIRPSFFSRRTLSLSRTGIGRIATTISETIVTTAYPVKEGPGARHVPAFRGFHDLSTGEQAKIRERAHPRWAAKTSPMVIQTTRR